MILPLVRKYFLSITIFLTLCVTTKISYADDPDLITCCSCLQDDPDGMSQAACASPCGGADPNTATYNYADCPIDEDIYWVLAGAVVIGFVGIKSKWF